jgi:hypothetical protein
MASGHTSDNSPGADSGTSSDRERTDPSGLDDADVITGRTSRDRSQALADAAANSSLAQKLKDRPLEQAIDKPTQEFKRKRNSSAGSMAGKKPAEGRHDSAGLPAELGPLTTATDAAREPRGSSPERDVGDGGEDVDPSDIQFRKESIFVKKEKAAERDARSSLVDPKQLPSEEAQVSQPETPSDTSTTGAAEPQPRQPQDRLEGTTNGQAEQQETTPRYVNPETSCFV